MRRSVVVLLAGALSLGLMQIASAADMPVKAPIMKAPMVVPYSWSGFYIGGNAGYHWTDAKFDWEFAPGFPDSAANIAARGGTAANTLRQRGFTGGLQIGYNWQFNNIVAGLEADFNFLGGSASFGPQYVGGGLPAANTVTESARARWLATVRPRLGILVMPRTLLYATGGLAVARVKYFDHTDYLASMQEASQTTTRVGWTAGVGGEHALDNRWSVKGEWLYADLGSTSYNSINNVFPTAILTHNHKLTMNIVRLGINYKLTP